MAGVYCRILPFFMGTLQCGGISADPFLQWNAEDTGDRMEIFFLFLLSGSFGNSGIAQGGNFEKLVV